MKTFFLVICIIVVQTVVSKDPSVCDNAKRLKNFREFGYNPHPYDCTQFVQCFYYEGTNKVEPVYRNCDYGLFWDQHSLRCSPAKLVNCQHDKCKKSSTKFYKHSDQNKCNAYWICENGKSVAKCCPKGQEFNTKLGCVPNEKCKSMCPKEDRIPGCQMRPISGSASKYEQFTDNGQWKPTKCASGHAFKPATCSCSPKKVLVANMRCKPDVQLDFRGRRVRDVSGNGNRVSAYRVKLNNRKNSAYFDGHSSITVAPLKPSKYDKGMLVIKLKYREVFRNYNETRKLQALVTNGHCGRKASAMVAKVGKWVLLGADVPKTFRMYSLPTVNKKWKEIVYIHDKMDLEGRVCGASYSDSADGQLKDTRCGFRIGNMRGMNGYKGYLSNVAIYRCKPLDTIINIGY